PFFGEPRAEAMGSTLHHLVAREQDECPAACPFNVVRDGINGGLLESLRVGGRVGHAAEQVQFGLRAKIERAAKLRRAACGQPEPLLEVPEAVLTPRT